MDADTSYANEDMWRDSQYNDNYSTQGIQWPSGAFLVDLTNPPSPELAYRVPHDARCSPETIDLQSAQQYVDRRISAYEYPSFVPDIHQYQIPLSEMQSHINSPKDKILSNDDNLSDTPSQFLNDPETGDFSPTGTSEWTSSDYSESWQSQPACGPYTPVPSAGESFCAHNYGPGDLQQLQGAIDSDLSPAKLALTIQILPKRKLHHDCRHCSYSSQRPSDLKSHFRTVHSELLECQQCHETFSAPEHVNKHAHERKHEAFRCNECTTCTATFTRLDDLRRHNRKHQPDSEQFICPHCPVGTKGFTRKDKLTQHLESFHRIGGFPGTSKSSSCPHHFCAQYRTMVAAQTDSMPFSTSKEFRAHMSKVHDETPFPCPEPGCGRVGGKGYFREIDLRKHQRREHVNSEQPRSPAW